MLCDLEPMTSLLCSTLAGERAGVGEFDPLWFPPALSPVGWMSASRGVMNKGPGVGLLGSNPSSAQERCPWRRGLGVSPGTQGAHPARPQHWVLGGMGRACPHHGAQGLTGPPPYPGRRPCAGHGAHHRGSTPSRPGTEAVLPVGLRLCHSGGTGQSSGDGRAHRVKTGVDNAAFTGRVSSRARDVRAPRAPRAGHTVPLAQPASTSMPPPGGAQH